MKKKFHTPEGIIERELCQEEIEEFAQMGDMEALIFLKKQEYAKAKNNSEKIDILAEVIGLKDVAIHLK